MFRHPDKIGGGEGEETKGEETKEEIKDKGREEETEEERKKTNRKMMIATLKDNQAGKPNYILKIPFKKSIFNPISMQMLKDKGFHMRC